MDPEPKDAGTAQAAPTSPLPGTGSGQEPPADTTPAADPRVEAANREAAKYRRELRDLQAWKEQQEAAQLSEAERLQKAATTAEARATTAEARARAAALQVAILTAAPAVNLLPAAYADALKLLNADLVEWDDATGDPTRASVKRALEALVKDRPYLVNTAPAPAPGPSAFAPHGNGGRTPDVQAQAGQAPLYNRF